MLPVLDIERKIIDRLRRSNRLVLTAPTGSGKTTQVPQILHRGGIIDGQIIVLQPRRLATRMVAARVAQEMKTPLGDLVGYQTRHDSAVGPNTRIRFMTEGLLLRLMQSDASLRGVGVVILDEFHERNLAADIALGLLKRLQASQRPNLRLMVMSATLDTDALSRFLECEVLRAGGRLFPIEIDYLLKPAIKPIWDVAALALESELQRQAERDVLIFMPGAYEINRTIQSCQRRVAVTSDALRFFPLHGSLSPAEQDAAVAPSSQRKVIVATNVAETSITIEGIGAVIDSGQAKIHRYDPHRALNVLRMESISRASADQRAGRAGRTGPGRCLRLWTQKDHGARTAHDAPEILRLELSEAMLQLLSMGVDDIAAFDWLDPPSATAVDQAAALLTSLQAIDLDRRLTDTGRRMAGLPVHPRLSRMLVAAADRGCLDRAVVWAALLNERDVLSDPQQRILLRYLEPGEPPSDLAARERLLDELRAVRFDRRRCVELGANPIACREVHQTARQLSAACRRLGFKPGNRSDTASVSTSLLFGFHDHVALKLEDQRPNCAMAGRKRVALDQASVVREAGLLVALDMREIGRGDQAQTHLALANRVELDWLREVRPEALTESFETIWNPQTQAVEQAQRTLFNGLEIARTLRPNVNPADAAAMLVQKIIDGELKLEYWDETVEQWIARTRCLRQWSPQRQLIDYDENDRRVILLEIVEGATRYNQIKDRQCMNAVRGALSWDDQRFVEQMAPESIQLPSGHRMKLRYEPGQPPRGRAKIQDFYGLHETPRVGGGRIDVLLEILAPNFRPVQVTTDLRGFWQTLYPELKKELRRRYPKHQWR